MGKGGERFFIACSTETGVITVSIAVAGLRHDETYAQTRSPHHTHSTTPERPANENRQWIGLNV